MTALPSPPALIKQKLSVGALLALGGLQIPIYQRPYKWTERHVAQLFADVYAHQHKSAYRLGTVVFHGHESKLDIVDGQQRTLTLLLAVRAINAVARDKVKCPGIASQLATLAGMGRTLEFSNDQTIRNLHQNYQAICQIVGRPEFTEAMVSFLLNRCEVVCFTLDNVSEAFQFFDSQNSRGRDLEPHDLLKAYHLREFAPEDERLKAKTVGRWEARETKELVQLFSQYLFRIRNWAKGSSARYFGKVDIPLFKGVSLHTAGPYPYVEQLRITHHWVDQYNRQPERHIDRQHMEYPFNLDQMVLNGRRFFEMAEHYHHQIARVRRHIELLQGTGFESFASRIFDTLARYPGRNRSGDGYVRVMFDCVLIYYIDKFGLQELGRVVEKAFIWAYSLRLKMHAVQLASVDNYVLANNLFRRIQVANSPADFLLYTPPRVKAGAQKNADPLVKLFEDMKFYG